MGTCVCMLSFKCPWRYPLGLWIFVTGVVLPGDKDLGVMKECAVAEIWILNEAARGGCEKKGLG